ncbi:MAG TPA: hypothetical protein VF576_02155, partial [Rubricoccaceae bacterium]
MAVFTWTAVALALGAVGGALIWSVLRVLRRAALARRREAAWATFSEGCPEPPPGDDGSVYPLSPTPGPAGEVAVRPDGLCLRLDDYPGRTLWVPWGDVRRVEPAVH